MEFGVLEARDVAAANKWEYLIEVRRTPVFDRLLRFEFDRGRGGAESRDVRSAYHTWCPAAPCMAELPYPPTHRELATAGTR